MAIRSRGTNNKRLGYSEESLRALERGKYDQLTGRDPKYRTSQQQTNQVKELPKLKRTANTVSTPQTTKPSTRYENQNVLKSTPKISTRDTKFDKDLDELWNYRFGDFSGEVDYDPVMDIDKPHWQTVREQIKRRNKWTDEELDTRFKAYDEERLQKTADQLVESDIKFAKKHPVAGTLLQALYTPQNMIEGAAAMLSNLAPDKYKAQSADDTLFTGTREKEAIKQAVKDEHIKSGLGKGAYDIGTSLGDMLISAGIPVLGTGALGAQAAARTNMQALERGVDPNKAALTGAGAGVVSGILNKVGFDKAVNTTGKTALGAVLKAAGIEGAENVAEDTANIALDTLVNTDKSQLGAMHDYYVSQGMSDNEAWNKVRLDTLGDLGTSALSGAAFGGLMSAGKNLPALRGLLGNRNKTETGIPEVDNAIKQTNDATAKIQELSEQVPKVEDTNRPLTDEELDALNAELNNMWAPDAGESAPTTNVDFKASVHNADGQLLDTVKVPEYSADSNVYFNGSDADIAIAEAQEAAIIDTFKNIVSDPEFNALSFKNGNKEVFVSPATNGNGLRMSYTIDGVPTGHHDYSLDQLDELSKSLRNEAGNGGEDIKVQRKSDLAKKAENKVVNESAERNPRLVQKLEGEERVQAETKKNANDSEIRDINKRIKTLDELIKTSKGKKKTELQAQKKAETKRRTELQTENKGLKRSLEGGTIPVEEYLKDTNSELHKEIYGRKTGLFDNLNYVAKHAGDTPEAKQLVKDIKKAIEDFVETGDINSTIYSPETIAKINQLDTLANTVDAEYIGHFRDNATFAGNDGNPSIWNALEGTDEEGGLLKKIGRYYDENIRFDEPAEAPENNVPNLDGMMPGDNRKTSQYYKNTMRNTEENIKMSDEEYASRFNEEEYKYDPTSDKANIEEGKEYIRESGGHDAAVERLLNEKVDEEVGLNHRQIDAGHILADESEKVARDLEAQGLDASEKWYEAHKLHKKLQRGGTINAQAMQALKKWKDKTPRGAVDYLISETNRGIDEKKTKGYTSMVEDLADDVEDAIRTNEGEGLIQKIKDIFAKNREKSSYKTDKYEQMVLDLVGGEDAHKVSSADLAAEAAKLIKRQMGVSSLTIKEERAMINLLEEAAKYEQGSRAYNELVSRAMTIFDDSLPSSTSEKVRSFMYDNMLASLKTMFTRNFGGNLGANLVENIATPLQVGVDKLVSLKTGSRTRKLTGKAIVEGTKGMGKGFKDVWLDIRHGVNTTRSGQGTLKDSWKAVHRTFKTDSNNKIIKGLNKAGGAYDRAVRKIMEGGDRPIYEAKYAATKAELYELVDKYGDAGLRKGLPKGKDYKTDDLIELIAINDALESVLQNDSTMKEAAKALKQAISKTSEDALGFDIASMSTVPFIEVPANMASRFFQYTPIGVVGNAARTIREIRKYGEINQRRFTGEAGRNILGGLMQAGAFGLAAAGNVSGAYSEDTDERKLQQNNGYQEYALQDKNGDTQVDISDIPVLGPMLRYGKMQRDAYEEGGIPGLVKNIPSAAGAATVDSLYQGLNKLTGASSKYNSGESMLDNAKNAIMSSVGSLLNPSIIRQTAQYLDPYKRDLGDYGTAEYNKNLIINGLPKLREMLLEPKIDTAGNEVKELAGDEGVARFLNAYLAPWKITHPNRNMSDAQKYANAIKEQTGGEVNPQPPVVNSGDLKKLKGYDAENYSHGDLSKLQKEYYTKNTELADSLISQDWFQKLDPEKQGKYLDDLYSASKEVVKEDFVREGMTPEEIEKAGDTLYTGDDRLGKIIRDDDENHTGMLEYMQNKSNLDDLNSKYDTDMGYDTYVKWETDPEKKALGGAETYASTYHKAKDLDMTVDNYLKAEKEYPGGAEQRAKDNAILKDINTEYGTGFNIESYKKYGEQGLEQRAQDANKAIEYGYVDKNGNANTDAYEKAVEIVGDNPQALKSYQNFKSKDYTKMSQKVPALIDDKSFTNSQKGMLVTGKTDPSKLEGKVVTGAYEKGGWDGVWYYYMLRGLADKDGSGRLDKQEKNEIRKLMNSDSPYVTQIPNEVYYYLGNTIKNW